MENSNIFLLGIPAHKANWTNKDKLWENRPEALRVGNTWRKDSVAKGRRVGRSGFARAQT